MAMTCHQVFLLVSDFEASVSFYEDALGLSLESRSEQKATFETGRCSLVLQADFDAKTLAAFGMEPPGEQRGAGAIIVIEVPDVEAVYERAQEASATILASPQHVDWGREMMLVEDPDGYVLELSRPTE